MKLTKRDYRLYDAAKVGEWIDCNFLLTDGEEVLVELKKKEKETIEMIIARCEQKLEGNDLEVEECYGLVDGILAEMMGLDTY